MSCSLIQWKFLGLREFWSSCTGAKEALVDKLARNFKRATLCCLSWQLKFTKQACFLASSCVATMQKKRRLRARKWGSYLVECMKAYLCRDCTHLWMCTRLHDCVGKGRARRQFCRPWSCVSLRADFPARTRGREDAPSQSVRKQRRSLPHQRASRSSVMSRTLCLSASVLYRYLQLTALQEMRAMPVRQTWTLKCFPSSNISRTCSLIVRFFAIAQSIGCQMPHESVHVFVELLPTSPRVVFW